MSEEKRYWLRIPKPIKIGKGIYAIKFENKWYKLKLIDVFNLWIPEKGDVNEFYFEYADREYERKPKEIKSDFDGLYYWLLLKNKPKIIEPYKCMFMFHLDFAKRWGVCRGTYGSVINFDLRDFYFESVGVYFTDEEVREQWGGLYDEEAESLKGKQ